MSEPTRKDDAVRYNVGDKVRIIRDSTESEDRSSYIGEIHTIDRYDTTFGIVHTEEREIWGYCFDDIPNWFWTDDELESANVVHFELPDELFEVT